MNKASEAVLHTPQTGVLDWLLNSDPGIRWQVLQDLTDEHPPAIEAERARVASEGWGAQLLAFQSPEGHWGGEHEDRGLLITLYSLVVLKDLGLDPRSEPSRRMIDRIQTHLIFREWDHRRFFEGEVETCINGRILGLGAYFAQPNDALAERLLGEQLADGGWNCEAPQSRCSSFHTTLCVLEGLLDYQRAGRDTVQVAEARERAERYLLERHLLRSLRSGQIIDPHWSRFAYPPFWHYDILRGLDYLREAGLVPDDRVQEAVQCVLARRLPDGRWTLDHLHKEQIPVPLETDVGGACRANTLRALRVLRWFEVPGQAAA